MVNLANAIITLVPNARPLIDFVVSDGGGGPVITYWDSIALGSQPSQSSLDAVTQAQVDVQHEQQRQVVIGVQTIRRKAADQASTVTALADVTDLSFQLAPNTHYKFRFLGAYTSAVSTTGLTIAVNGPASPLFLRFVAQIAMTTTTAAYGASSGYDVPLTAPTGGGATPLPFSLEGTISTGAAGGAFTLRFASEVGGSTVTILRGSLGELAAAA